MMPAVCKILCCCTTLKLNFSFFSFPSFSFSFLFFFFCLFVCLFFTKIKDVVRILQKRFLEQTALGSDDPSELALLVVGGGGGGGRGDLREGVGANVCAAAISYLAKPKRIFMILNIKSKNSNKLNKLAPIQSPSWPPISPKRENSRSHIITC